MYPFEIISEKVWMPTGNFIVFAIFCLFFYKVNEKIEIMFLRREYFIPGRQNSFFRRER